MQEFTVEEIEYHVKWLLSKKVLKHTVKVGERHTAPPTWEFFLEYEHRVRKGAARLMAHKRSSLVGALASVRRNDFIYNRYFLTELSQITKFLNAKENNSGAFHANKERHKNLQPQTSDPVSKQLQLLTCAITSFVSAQKGTDGFCSPKLLAETAGQKTKPDGRVEFQWFLRGSKNRKLLNLDRDGKKCATFSKRVVTAVRNRLHVCALCGGNSPMDTCDCDRTRLHSKVEEES